MLLRNIIGTASLIVISVSTNVIPVQNTAELEKIGFELHGIREKCLVEELPEKTVILVKYSATAWSNQNKNTADVSLQLLTTVKKLGLEVFIGDAGDPHITSPVEAQLNDLAFQIGKGVDQASDLQREQTLQRDREQHFRSRSDRVNGKVLKWAILQAIILTLTGWLQVHHLRRFFRHKKLV